MITSRTAKEWLSEITGIAVVTEDATSYQARVREVQGYYRRRHEMASDAAEEYKSLETLRFAKDSLAAFRSFDPSLISRRRWLNISGYQFPLRSQRSN